MAIPFIMITLDKPWKLRFGMGAMVEFEQLTGLKIKDINSELSMDQTSKLLWCMLRQQDSSITLSDTLKLVDEYAMSLSDIIDKISEAVSAAFATDEEITKGKEDPNAPTP